MYLEGLGVHFDATDKPLTLHCLLTHTCGFNDANIGYMARDADGVLPLLDYIKKANPGIYQEPESEISYSNYSYALAGLIVEIVSGKPYAMYVANHILEPLGMANSTLDFPYGYETKPGYASAYEKVGDSYREVQLYPRHAIPAGSLVTTTEDMGLLIRALFTKDPAILTSRSWEAFYRQQFTNHPLLGGYGYGLERQNINGITSWAKGGMLPGALSHILIVPDEFALFSSLNTSQDIFGEFFFETLFDETFPETDAVGQSFENVSTTKFTGTYRNNRYSRKTEENIVSLFQGEFNVYENETSDSLVLHHNGKWHTYVPIDDGIFQNELIPSEFLVFIEDQKGALTLYRNSNIGGLSIPSSYKKTQWYNSPSFINDSYGVIPIFTFTGLFFMIASFFVWLKRRWNKNFFNSKTLPLQFHILFGFTILLHMVHTWFVPYQILTKSRDFLFGYPLSFSVPSALGYLLIPLTLWIGIQIVRFWRQKQGTLFSRLYLSLVELSLLVHLIFLFYWNFL